MTRIEQSPQTQHVLDHPIYANRVQRVKCNLAALRLFARDVYIFEMPEKSEQLLFRFIENICYELEEDVKAMWD